ncbi:SGNH/GDSL hydrolase family protein [Candidatus Woesearchaeota archaeon]|nr:SGNH/GDSL hydrolase family protein [Candidatus Woesearchaeota archaeon]
MTVLTKKLKEIAINLSILLVVIFLFFFIFEMLLRNAVINPQLLAQPNIHTQLNTSEYAITITTNSIGARDSEHSFAKEKNTYRIVVIGDSFVLGLGINAEDGFQKKLEQKLDEALKTKLLQQLSEKSIAKIEVISLGNTGYGPTQYKQLLKTYGLKYDPDLIIVSYFVGNDIVDVRNPYLQENKINRFFKDLVKRIYVFNYLSLHLSRLGQSNALDNSPITKFPIDVANLYPIATKEGISKDELQKRIDAMDPILLEEVNKGSINVHELKNALIHPQITHDVLFLDNEKIQQSWKETQSNLIAMNAIAKNNNILIVFMLMPPSIQIAEKYHQYSKKVGYEISDEMLATTMPQDFFKEFAEKNNLFVIDLLPLLRENKEELYYLKDGHFTPLGHEIAADYLFINLEEKGLLS